MRFVSFFFSSRRRHTRWPRDWSSDVCSSDLAYVGTALGPYAGYLCGVLLWLGITLAMGAVATVFADAALGLLPGLGGPLPRSEERRVGKECRSRCAADD